MEHSYSSKRVITTSMIKRWMLFGKILYFGLHKLTEVIQREILKLSVQKTCVDTLKDDIWL